jgi:hypothetical protein
VLDLRVQSSFGSHGTNRFSIIHLTTNGHTVVDDILEAVNQFHFRSGQWDRCKEIIVLNFHELKNFTAAGRAELASEIKRFLGDIIIGRNLRDLTIGQIWNSYPART